MRIHTNATAADIHAATGNLPGVYAENYGVSPVGFGGTVGGDGACEGFSFAQTFEGVEWVTYVYPVYMPDRFHDWDERNAGSDWDVETVDMSEDDVSEYHWPTLNGCATEAKAVECAKWIAEEYRAQAVRMRKCGLVSP